MDPLDDRNPEALERIGERRGRKSIDPQLDQGQRLLRFHVVEGEEWQLGGTAIGLVYELADSFDHGFDDLLAVLVGCFVVSIR